MKARQGDRLPRDLVDDDLAGVLPAPQERATRPETGTPTQRRDARQARNSSQPSHLEQPFSRTTARRLPQVPGAFGRRPEPSPVARRVARGALRKTSLHGTSCAADGSALASSTSPLRTGRRGARRDINCPRARHPIPIIRPLHAESEDPNASHREGKAQGPGAGAPADRAPVRQGRHRAPRRQAAGGDPGDLHRLHHPRRRPRHRRRPARPRHRDLRPRVLRQDDPRAPHHRRGPEVGRHRAFIDAEHALDADYAKKLGVDIDNLLVSQPDTGEQALEIADPLVRSNAVDVIVVDSVAALVPERRARGRDGRRASSASRPA